MVNIEELLEENIKLKKENELLKEELKVLKDDIKILYCDMMSLDVIKDKEQEIEVL